MVFLTTWTLNVAKSIYIECDKSRERVKFLYQN